MHRRTLLLYYVPYIYIEQDFLLNFEDPVIENVDITRCERKKKNKTSG